jgi:large subunit ribosomal protein L4
MELPVKNTTGQVAGKIEVADIVFGVAFNAPMVHQVAMGHLANRRVGTASTKTRGEVRGGGRKPWTQKGTGRARQGSTRSPQWRGGGVVFGPKPRDYHHHTPKRMRRGAIRCMLAQRVREGALTVVEGLTLDNHRTKEILNLLAALEINTKSLVVSSEAAPGLALACRNLRQIKSLPASNLNTLDLLDFDHVIMSVDAVRKVEKLWSSDRPSPRSFQSGSTNEEVAE